MNDSTVLRLDDLPVEMLSEIFQYLSIQELYASFSYINTRLNSIFRSLPNLNLITTSHSDPVLSFFNSFNAVKIDFNPSTSSSLSRFNFWNFIGIRSFIISEIVNRCHANYIEPFEQIDKFISPNLCPRLHCLRIPYCSQRLVDWIFSGAFPHLKICDFYEYRYRKTVLLPTTTSTISTLRQLTMQEMNANEIEKIFLLCPNLVYLYFNCSRVLPSFVHLNSRYSSMKGLNIYRLEIFLFHNGQFDSFLALFPNLRLLHLTVHQHPLYNEIIDFDKLAYCFRHRLPHLTTLYLCIHLTKRNHDTYSVCEFKKTAQMHPLFKYFGKSHTSIHIASFDFTSIYRYDQPEIYPLSAMFLAIR